MLKFMKPISPITIIFFLLLHAPGQIFSQSNLLEAFNPGFESSFTNWGGAGFTNASIDTTNSNEGVRSAKHSANTASGFNVIVNTGATIAATPGRAYQLSIMTRQTLAGGAALLGLCELNSSMMTTRYTWKTVSNSTNWHSEYLTVVPRVDTAYLRIYLQVSPSATAGAAWWDSCRLIAVNPTPLTPATTNPFTDNTNLQIDIAPLPVSVFTRGGTTISPEVMVPAVNFGTLLVGGSFTWKIVATPTGPSGTPILQGEFPISKTGLWAWTINLNASSSLFPSGNYLLMINAESQDHAVTRISTRPFFIQ